MSEFISILPPNEEAALRTLEEYEAQSFDFKKLEKVTFEPLVCDKCLLPHLALDLDVNLAGLNEDEQRAYLHNAREIKRKIGTVWAVNSAASSIFKDNIKIRPWNEIGTPAGTYKIEVNATGEKEVNDENLNKTIKLIDEVKPKSRHLAGITINMKNSSAYEYATVTTASETITVLPQQLEDVNVQVGKKVLLAVHSIEDLKIMPKEG